MIRRRIRQLLGSVALLSLASVGCSRDHINAIELANAADKSVEVNVEGAIGKYDEATRLDPKNHRIIWKLAKAYEKKEDWDNMASTLAKAIQAAPEFANYYYRRGYAIMQLARSGKKEAYEEAKEPLKKCIEKDPNYAECYNELGEALLWTDDEQGAVENFQKAIEHDPTVPYFYPALAEVLTWFKMYDEAEKVLKEGARVIQPTDKSKNALHNMYTLIAQTSQARGDMTAMVSALEKANEVGGTDHPEDAYNLGSSYAVLKPPNKERAVRYLKSFSKTTCRGAKAATDYKEQCAAAQDLITKLGGDK